MCSWFEALNASPTRTDEEKWKEFQKGDGRNGKEWELEEL
jgi:hypothetical protein